MTPARPPTIVVVDDRAPSIRSLLGQLRSGRPCRILVLDHDEALARRHWPDGERVVCAALRHPAVQVRDPTAPLLAGPEVAHHIRSRSRAEVIGHAPGAARPEINIPFRQAGAVAVYDDADLAAVARGLLVRDADRWRGQVRRPTAEDFAALGLPPDADLWGAIRALRHRRPRDHFAHGDAWERVARMDPTRKIDDRTREYINDRVAPLLGITEGRARHRRVSDLLGPILGLPALHLASGLEADGGRPPAERGGAPRSRSA